MKRLILIILSLSFPFASIYAQNVETKDVRGNWYIVPYFHSDSLQLNFLDTNVTLTLIRHWHNSDKEKRMQITTTINYHLIKFKKESLLVFDITPNGFMGTGSTYLVKQLDHNTIKLQPIQSADLKDYNLKWSQKEDSTTLLVKRF